MNTGKHAHAGGRGTRDALPSDPKNAMVRSHFDQSPASRIGILPQHERRRRFSLEMKGAKRGKIQFEEGIAIQNEYGLSRKIRLGLLNAAPRSEDHRLLRINNPQSKLRAI